MSMRGECLGMTIRGLTNMIEAVDASVGGCMVEFYVTTNPRRIRGRVTYGFKETQKDFVSETGLTNIMFRLASMAIKARRKK
jgi:hypothetical protein